MLQLPRHARTSRPVATSAVRAPGSPARSRDLGLPALRSSACRPARLRRASRLLATVLCALLVAALAGLSPAAHADTPLLSVTAGDSVSSLLTSLRTNSGGTDVRYLDNAVWVDGSPQCYRCTLGPSVLTAARATSATDPLVHTAVATFDRAITTHQQPDGSWSPAAPGEGGNDIQTMLVGDELAWTYLLLGDKLDASHRTRWAQSLRESADWLIRNGDLSYYINGNLNLAVAINMDLTYRITGLSRFGTAADSALAFTLSPPQDRWAGYGLHLTTSPTAADGSDGAGYLGEAASGGQPGFDPAYTLVQTDLASMWFLMTGNPTALRLTNLFYNQLAPRVRQSDWTVDVSGGTRRNVPNARYPFSVSAVAVLALLGGRTDLQPLVSSQVTASLTTFTNTSRYVGPTLSYCFGSELAGSYVAVARTPGW